MRQLRVAEAADINTIMDIIGQAKAYLKAQGIDQWQTGYPDRACIERDIAAQKGYLLIEDMPDAVGIDSIDENVLGYVCIDFSGEPAYDGLKGQWLSGPEGAYVVAHRMAFSASSRGKGLATESFDLIGKIALSRDVSWFRVDTDEDNVIMKHLLAKNGFTYCGTIWFDNSVKIAYEKKLHNSPDARLSF